MADRCSRPLVRLAAHDDALRHEAPDHLVSAVGHRVKLAGPLVLAVREKLVAAVAARRAVGLLYLAPDADLMYLCHGGTKRGTSLRLWHGLPQAGLVRYRTYKTTPGWKNSIQHL